VRVSVLPANLANRGECAKCVGLQGPLSPLAWRSRPRSGGWFTVRRTPSSACAVMPTRINWIYAICKMLDATIQTALADNRHPLQRVMLECLPEVVMTWPLCVVASAEQQPLAALVALWHPDPQAHAAGPPAAKTPEVHGSAAGSHHLGATRLESVCVHVMCDGAPVATLNSHCSDLPERYPTTNAALDRAHALPDDDSTCGDASGLPINTWSQLQLRPHPRCAANVHVHGTLPPAACMPQRTTLDGTGAGVGAPCAPCAAAAAAAAGGGAGSASSRHAWAHLPPSGASGRIGVLTAFAEVLPGSPAAPAPGFGAAGSLKTEVCGGGASQGWSGSEQPATPVTLGPATTLLSLPAAAAAELHALFARRVTARLLGEAQGQGPNPLRQTPALEPRREASGISRQRDERTPVPQGLNNTTADPLIPAARTGAVRRLSLMHLPPTNSKALGAGGRAPVLIGRQVASHKSARDRPPAPASAGTSSCMVRSLSPTRARLLRMPAAGDAAELYCTALCC
jgi:hypothetical protein